MTDYQLVPPGEITIDTTTSATDSVLVPRGAPCSQLVITSITGTSVVKLKFGSDPYRTVASGQRYALTGEHQRAGVLAAWTASVGGAVIVQLNVPDEACSDRSAIGVEQ